MMTLSLLLAMSLYALVTSISPGPVNVVALSYGIHYGLRVGLIFVAGSAIGYTLLLLVVGLGLHRLLTSLPIISQAIRVAGIAFLLYLVYQFLLDKGEVTNPRKASPYPFLYGALMQWLNPKAWICAVAGIGAYTLQGQPLLVWQFALIYLVICFLSNACWSYAGVFLQHLLQKPRYLKRVNQAMALSLLICTVLLISF